MILTLKIALLSGAYATSNWEGVVEIDPSTLLEDLHLAIQRFLNFDDDHLYEFFTARTERSRDRISFDEESGSLCETTIESLFPLPERQHLYYLFDYGDCWIFKITKSRKALQEVNPDFTYPRLVHETGQKPEQYPSFEEHDA